MAAISRAWYNDSYTIAAKPIKCLELHYTMIQFLIICNIIQSQCLKEEKSHNRQGPMPVLRRYIVIYFKGKIVSLISDKITAVTNNMRPTTLTIVVTV